MSFAIVIIIFTILTGIAGSLLANHYSVYALLPITFFFLALAAAGCVVYGANLSGSAIAALSGVTGLQFGYLLRLFVLARAGCYVPQFEARTTGRPTSTPRRSGSGRPGDLFRLCPVQMASLRNTRYCGLTVERDMIRSRTN